MPKRNKRWSKKDIPDLTGKLSVVTGATDGLGYETALALAESKSTVIVAGRNDAKGKNTLDKILASIPEAKIRFEKVDLGNLESIKQFCTRINSKNEAVDILVNNAGICDLEHPKNRRITTDGFEAHLGINYLGHFALVAQLLPALKRSSEARVVNVGSLSYRFSKINFEDLQKEKGYRSIKAYAQSKLAIMLFNLELRRRSENGHWGLRVVSCHPGFAATTIATKSDTWFQKIGFCCGKAVLQDAAIGALPILFSSTDPDAQNGGYYGPTGRLGINGPVGPVRIKAIGQDISVAARLWDVSTELTNVHWPSVRGVANTV